MLSFSFGAEKGDTAATARAADLGSFRSILQCFLDKHIHLRSSHARRETLASRISVAHSPGDRLPVICQESVAHLLRRIAYAVEEREEFRIAVYVSFRNVPVVRPRKARLARIADRNATLKSLFINGKRLALDSIR